MRHYAITWGAFFWLFFVSGCVTVGNEIPIKPALSVRQYDNKMHDPKRFLPYKKRQVQIKGVNFVLEVADTSDLRVCGLMDRSTLADDAGMMFVYQSPRPVSFWMAHTYINLDLILLDKNGVILQLYSMQIETPKRKDESEHAYRKRLKHYDSKEPVAFAIELNQGMIVQLGLKIGDRINLNIPKE